MKARNSAVPGLLAIIWLTALVLGGCSDGTITTVVSQDTELSDDIINAYLPTAEGYTVAYNVYYSNGTSDMTSIAVGREVQLGSVSAIEWIARGENGADTGYISVSADWIYFYESTSSAAEKIIEMPLTTGQSWLRFSDSDDIDDGLTDIITGIEDTIRTDIESSGKVFPSVGEDLMTVAGREPVRLSNGLYFSDAAKIYNENSADNTKNFYWWVANVGLVKYVLGATDEQGTGGNVVGEMVDYGF